MKPKLFGLPVAHTSVWIFNCYVIAAGDDVVITATAYDNDGVLDIDDPDDENDSICGDSDGDTCDDCALGAFDIVLNMVAHVNDLIG